MVGLCWYVTGAKRGKTERVEDIHMAVNGTSLLATLWDSPTTPSYGADYDYDNGHAHDNEIVAQKQAPLKSLHMVAVIIYSIAFVLGVTGNGLVIFITGFRMKRTVNTIWFLNLAVADFIFTFFLPLYVAYTALGFHWPFGKALCKINSALAFLNLYASVYFLMVISLDRCISVVHPVWAQSHRTPRLASLVALAVWVVAMALCFPYLYFRHTAPSQNNKNITICYNNFDTAGEGATNAERARRSVMINQAMIISRFVLSFLIPFTIIMVCYGAIISKLRRKRLARSGKPFKVIAVVIVAFFLCWFPYHIFSFLEMNYRPELETVLTVGIPLVSSVAFINGCLNPILYVFMGQDFKGRLRGTLFSAFENAFHEKATSSSGDMRTKSIRKMDSQVI
ncbi:chemerin-like receptor 1 [Emydura macquarii macquarii]|uniref:chemerin-like receptor 1 n=1 Tax=Emydura macquarii macquarii TaxID=1129001 RepID=UPI00352B1C52